MDLPVSRPRGWHPSTAATPPSSRGRRDSRSRSVLPCRRASSPSPRLGTWSSCPHTHPRARPWRRPPGLGRPSAGIAASVEPASPPTDPRRWRRRRVWRSFGSADSVRPSWSHLARRGSRRFPRSCWRRGATPCAGSGPPSSGYTACRWGTDHRPSEPTGRPWSGSRPTRRSGWRRRAARADSAIWRRRRRHVNSWRRAGTRASGYVPAAMSWTTNGSPESRSHRWRVGRAAGCGPTWGGDRRSTLLNSRRTVSRGLDHRQTPRCCLAPTQGPSPGPACRSFLHSHKWITR